MAASIVLCAALALAGCSGREPPPSNNVAHKTAAVGGVTDGLTPVACTITLGYANDRRKVTFALTPSAPNTPTRNNQLTIYRTDLSVVPNQIVQVGIMTSPASVVAHDLMYRPGDYRFDAVFASGSYCSGYASLKVDRPQQVAGFADIHLHQFANLAVGGRFVAGRSGDGLEGRDTDPLSPYSGKGISGRGKGGAQVSYISPSDVPIVLPARWGGGLPAEPSSSALRSVATNYGGDPPWSVNDANVFGTRAHQPLEYSSINGIEKALTRDLVNQASIAWPSFSGWPRNGGANPLALCTLSGFPFVKDSQKVPQLWEQVSGLTQESYKPWLKRAVDGGLRLEVMMAVNNAALCEVMGTSGSKFNLGPLMGISVDSGPIMDGSPLDCSDRAAVRRQIDAAYRFQAEVDFDCGDPAPSFDPDSITGHCGWYRIVTTPEAARAVINQNKLAVVLGVEVDNLFDCVLPESNGSLAKTYGKRVCTDQDVIAGVQDLRAQGVTHVFPTHYTDLFVAAADFYNLQLGSNVLVNGTGYPLSREVGDTSATGMPNANKDLAQANQSYASLGDWVYDAYGKSFNIPKGDAFTRLARPIPLPRGILGYGTGLPGTNAHPGFLGKPLGVTLIEELAKNHMIIDIDHMSARGHQAVRNLMRGWVQSGWTSGLYPIVSGHAEMAAIHNTAGMNRNPDADHVSDMVGEAILFHSEANDVASSGGIIGTFLGPKGSTLMDDPAHSLANWNTVVGPGGATVTPTCGGSSKFYAQSLLSAANEMLSAYPQDVNKMGAVQAVAFGSDFNSGFAMIRGRSAGGSPSWSCLDGVPGSYFNGSPNEFSGPSYSVDVDSPWVQIRPGLGGVKVAASLSGSNVASDGFLNGTTALARPLLNPQGHTLVGFPSDEKGRMDRNEVCLQHTADKAIGNARCMESKYLDSSIQWVTPSIGSTGQIREYVVGGGRCLSAPLDPNGLVAKGPSGGLYWPTVSYAVMMPCGSPGFSQQWTMRASGRIAAAGSNSNSACLSVNGHVTDCMYGVWNLSDPSLFFGKGGDFQSFNNVGLQTVGMYPDFMAELAAIGVGSITMNMLYSGAEGYLQTWERAHYTAPQNLALGKPTSSSSSLANDGYPAIRPENGVDGKKRPLFSDPVTSTTWSQAQTVTFHSGWDDALAGRTPTWTVDLQGLYSIGRIDVINRYPDEYGMSGPQNMNGWRVELSSDWGIEWVSQTQDVAGYPTSIIPDPGIQARYIRIIGQPGGFINFSEVEVFGERPNLALGRPATGCVHDPCYAFSVAQAGGDGIPGATYTTCPVRATPDRAVDGDATPVHTWAQFQDTGYHSCQAGMSQYGAMQDGTWEVDLGTDQRIGRIEVVGRWPDEFGYGGTNNLDNWSIALSTSGGLLSWSMSGLGILGEDENFTTVFTPNRFGRFVRITPQPGGYANFAEVRVYR